MDLVRMHRRGAVATVSIHNPPLNFVTGEVMTALERTVRRCEADPSLRCVVLTGAVPNVFINHYDIDELLEGAARAGVSMPPALAPAALGVIGGLLRIPALGPALARGPGAGVAALLRFHRVVRLLVNSRKIYVAAINGPAVGGGFELALACDLRVMVSEGATVGLLETLLGLLPGGGGSQILTRTLGPSRAMAMFLEGRLLTAREAQAEGIVHLVVPPDELTARVGELADRLATRSPAAVQALKRAVYQGSSRELGRGLAGERAAFLAVVSRPTAQDALKTYQADLHAQQRQGQRVGDFFEQRIPTWRDGSAARFAD